jgi:hypothetical protein
LSGWQASGNGLRQGPSNSGEFTVSASGDTALTSLWESGLYTNLLSSRMNGAVRSPYLPKDKKYLSVRMMGGSLASRRTVIDNCAIGETYKVLENDAPEWVRVDTVANAPLPVFAELVTRSDNPRLPDRPEVLKPDQAKLLTSPDSYFGITEAVLHDTPELPREKLEHLMQLFGDAPANNWQELAARYQSAVATAIDHWSSSGATDDDVKWLNWALRNKLISNSANATPTLKALIANYRALEKTIPEPRVVEGLSDYGEGKDFPVLLAGNAKNPGKAAPRRFLRKLFGDAPFATKGSGRRELAELIASPDNPLTSRVMANRIWSYVFGKGLVASVDNFGLLGEAPSHPELLDYLAVNFVEQGWSIKKMVRSLVLSNTFKQGGAVLDAAREVDPENRLLHHYPLRRLEAESIRDSILQSSNSLKEEPFGPSIDPYREEAKDYRRLFAGPLDGGGRRSLYLKVTRMEGTKFLDMFDYPSAMATRGSRDVTNVPAQSLTLLNDPFVIAQAEIAARHLVDSKSDSIDERIVTVFRKVLGRSPDSEETARFTGLVRETASLRRIPASEILDSVAVWKDLIHSVFNLKEFLYVQ